MELKADYQIDNNGILPHQIDQQILDGKMKNKIRDAFVQKFTIFIILYDIIYGCLLVVLSNLFVVLLKLIKKILSS